MECVVAGKCKKSGFCDDTAHMSRDSQKYKQTSGCQNGVTYIYKNCILSGFIAMFLFSARSVKL